MTELALARIAGVPWWRRALAWWRTRRVRREIEHRALLWTASEARRASAVAYDAEYVAWVQGGRCGPMPLPMPGDLEPMSG